MYNTQESLTWSRENSALPDGIFMSAKVAANTVSRTQSTVMAKFYSEFLYLSFSSYTLLE